MNPGKDVLWVTFSPKYLEKNTVCLPTSHPFTHLSGAPVRRSRSTGSHRPPPRLTVVLRVTVWDPRARSRRTDRPATPRPGVKTMVPLSYGVVFHFRMSRRVGRMDMSIQSPSLKVPGKMSANDILPFLRYPQLMSIMSPVLRSFQAT